MAQLVPNYEVKLLMPADEVLNSDGELKKGVWEAFDIKKKKVSKMAIQFVDTPDQIIYKSGWNLRIRKSDPQKDDEGFGLTYKKRFRIDTSKSTDPAANISAAVEVAHNENFPIPFEAQVEVGYNQQTLSISADATGSDKGYDELNLPHAKDASKMLMKGAPTIFTDSIVSAQTSGFGGLLDNAVVYGPVHATRYQGSLDEKTLKKIYIEVWPIRTSKTDGTLIPIVEASFKADHLEDALAGQTKLANFLKKHEWFSDTDSLKTKLIMDRYGDVSAN